MFANEPRTERVIKLQQQPDCIRNISIVAHVDHGKTTLADGLISANGIISKKMAGSLRYMDDRVDEQDRGITMKSSSISLLASHSGQEYLVNLIDSPGHVQFGFEVSAALRLTDGALLVVDVLEGVSSQTYRVLLQTFEERVASVLVLNKIDKLIRDRQLSPLEAYRHLQQIIEQVNAILGSFINRRTNELADLALSPQKKSSREYTANELQEKHLDELESKYYFSVEKNNIVFCSAVDGWAFTPKDFSPLISKKLGLDEALLNKCLWGDYYYHPKLKAVQTEPRNQNDRPLCVELVLQSIWDVYQKVFEKDVARVEKIIKFFDLKISERVKQTYDYPLIKEILNSWLPLDKVIFRTVIETLPSPVQAQKTRLGILFSEDENTAKVKSDIQAVHMLKKAVEMCDNRQDAPVVVFISKMVSIPKASFNERGLNELVGQGKDRTLGFARVYSGRLRRGQTVHVIGPKPKKVEVEGTNEYEWDVQTTQIDNIYILMAQHPEGVKEIPAGNLVGIGNLENIIFKSGTLSTIRSCPSLAPLASTSKAILKVAVTTPNLQHAAKLIEGLKKLNKSDPSIEVSIAKNGDIILSTCGEVHLERCMIDLENIFALVPVKRSDPIINFRETIIWSNLAENNNEKIIEQMKKKKREQMKKELIERLKREARQDTELDEIEQSKLKAIETWEAGVEKYDSDALTTTDTRYFLKTKQEEETEKDKQVYRREKEMKKVDYRNRGKQHAKGEESFLNLSERTNWVILSTPNLALKIKVKAISFPFEVAEFIEKNIENMKDAFFKGMTEERLETGKRLLKSAEEMMMEHKLDKDLFVLIKEKLCCFGPNRIGPNLLLIRDLNPARSIFDMYSSEDVADFQKRSCSKVLLHSDFLETVYCDYNLNERELMNAIILGFDLAVQSGPLCEEPMMGTCFIVEEFIAGGQQKVEDEKDLLKNEIQTKAQKEKEKEREMRKEIKEKKVEEQAQAAQQERIQQLKTVGAKESEPEIEPSTKLEQPQPPEKEDDNTEEVSAADKKSQKGKSGKERSVTSDKKTINSKGRDAYGPLAGQIITVVKDACLQSFIGARPHLVEPVYECNLQTHEEYYGGVHSSLARRKAKIISEDLHESSNLFLIKAQLPVQESFGFCNELLTMTQGRVNAQLYFDTWKIIELDPFYTPLTKEEIEENGVENIIPNQARQLIQKIRKSKGLITTEKVVAAAEKQRTLKKN